MNKNITFLVCVVFVVGIGAQNTWARSLKIGEIYQTEDGSVKIEVASPNQVEIDNGDTIILADYNMKGEKLRIVYKALGTTIVEYYLFVDEGIRSEKKGTLYYTSKALSELKAKQKADKEAAIAEKKLQIERLRLSLVDTKWLMDKYQSRYCDGRKGSTVEMIFHDNNLVSQKIIKSIYKDREGKSLEGKFFKNDALWEAFLDKKGKRGIFIKPNLKKYPKANKTYIWTGYMGISTEKFEGLYRGYKHRCWSMTFQSDQ